MLEDPVLDACELPVEAVVMWVTAFPIPVLLHLPLKENLSLDDASDDDGDIEVVAEVETDFEEVIEEEAAFDDVTNEVEVALEVIFADEDVEIPALSDILALVEL